MTRPAEMLEGKTINGVWQVDSKIIPKQTATGGKFSTGYLVHHVVNGTKGFMKAMDYSAALQSANTMDEMKSMAESYTFERDICLKCRNDGVTRVIHAIDFGTYIDDPFHQYGNFFKVEYLIFERADCDIRSFLDQMAAFDLAFAFRTLHNSAAAIEQLHRAGMAHQDVKPSNVLVFRVDKVTKLGDLGRAWVKGSPAPHDAYDIAGDLGYAPLELSLREPVDEETRRFGCDMYLFGSLITFFFTRAHINSLVARHLSPTFHPSQKCITFSDILPYVQDAFSRALTEFSTHVLPQFRNQTTEMVRHMCEPDPSRRGDLRNSNRFSLERYISALDLLAFKAETNFRTGGRNARNP